MTGQLTGRVALITGGGSGIGRAAALEFARAGARVVVSDVDDKGGNETVRLVREEGHEAIFVMTDVTKAPQVEAMVRKAVETYGRIDCAFNNAGIVERYSPTANCAEETWDQVIDVNLKGVWLCMKYEISQMLIQGSGAIVNCSSVAGLRGDAGWPAYTASKHGVNGLTKAAAVEYAKHGIRINSVCPGPVRTPLWERDISGPDDERRILERQPLGRIGNPEEIAKAVIWLCSESASYVTGHPMVVDGGKVARLT